MNPRGARGQQGSAHPLPFLPHRDFAPLRPLARELRPLLAPSRISPLAHPCRELSVFPQRPHCASSPTGPLGSVGGAAPGIIEAFRPSWLQPG